MLWDWAFTIFLLLFIPPIKISVHAQLELSLRTCHFLILKITFCSGITSVYDQSNTKKDRYQAAFQGSSLDIWRLRTMNKHIHTNVEADPLHNPSQHPAALFHDTIPSSLAVYRSVWAFSLRNEELSDHTPSNEAESNL